MKLADLKIYLASRKIESTSIWYILLHSLVWPSSKESPAHKHSTRHSRMDGATGTNFGPASKMGKVEKICFSFVLHGQRRYTQQREVSLGSKTALRSLHIRMYMSSHYFLVVSRYEATDDWPFSSVQ
jgi:hypothetical protein